jgi:hypothetical protein
VEVEYQGLRYSSRLGAALEEALRQDHWAALAIAYGGANQLLPSALALPFLATVAPSARWGETHRKRHKTLADRARQAHPWVKSKGVPADQTPAAQPSAHLRRRQVAMPKIRRSVSVVC